MQTLKILYPPKFLWLHPDGVVLLFLIATPCHAIAYCITDDTPHQAYNWQIYDQELVLLTWPCSCLPLWAVLLFLLPSALSSWSLRSSPSYLCDLCSPVLVLAARWVLRSAASGELLVPQAHLATVQQRAFSVVGPSAWNDLPVEQRSLLMARLSKLYISV